ncbi:MAG: InlB B-repeat-containing protein, partial [Verrucomicrobiae bacterium]
VTYDATYGTLATVTRTGYTFNGWFTATGGGGSQVLSSTTVTITTAQTLYASWTPNTYTVTFDGNGGGTPSPTSKSVTYDATYGTLATVTRTGYTFNGWFTAANGGTQVTSGTTVAMTSAQTLYAQWTAALSAPNLTYTNAYGVGLRIVITDITNQLTSSQPSPLYKFLGIAPTSSQSGNVYTNSAGDTILYTPPNNTITSDTFTYYVNDGATTSAAATVTVNFGSVAGPSLGNNPTLDGNGHPVITLHGIPGYSYHIQRSPDLSVWTNAQVVTLPANGDGSYIWTNTSVTVPPDNAYYRISYP